MTTLTIYNRTFDAARKAQGFESQAHLDAFFAHYDHMKGCADCKALDGDMFLSDNSRQPFLGECPAAKNLSRAYLTSYGERS